MHLIPMAQESTLPLVGETPQETLSLLQKWLLDLWDWTVAFFPKLIAAVLIFAIGWWLSKAVTRLIRRAMLRGKADQAAVSFVCSFSLCALRIIVIISAVAQLGVNVNSIIAALGAAAVTVGLALKDSMSNIASGVLIIITKPFKAGDFLEFEGLQGTVTKIEIMNTYLNTVDNKEVIIPNSRLTANNVTNFTSHDMRRLDLSYSVSYGDDIVAAKRLLQELVSEHPLVFKEPEPVVGIADHNDSSISIDCKLWCGKDDYWPLYYEMQEKVKLMFDEHGINIPFNQLVVHMEPEKGKNQP